MTVRVIEVGGRPAIPLGDVRRARPAVDRSVLNALRCAAAVVLLVLALCGAVATASWEVAGTTPPNAPEPGLGL